MSTELIDSCLDPGRRQVLCPTETDELVHRRIQAAQAHHRSPRRDRYGPIRPYEPTARHGDSVQRSDHLAGDPSQPPTSSNVLNLLERASCTRSSGYTARGPKRSSVRSTASTSGTGTPTAAAAPIAQRSASNRRPSPARDTRTAHSRPTATAPAAWTSLTSPPTIRSHRTAESPEAAATIRPSNWTSVDRIEACHAVRHACVVPSDPSTSPVSLGWSGASRWGRPTIFRTRRCERPSSPDRRYCRPSSTPAARAPNIDPSCSARPGVERPTPNGCCAPRNGT